MKRFKIQPLFTLVVLLFFIASCASSTKVSSNVVRDASSMEKAVIVASIKEEYAYVRKVCPDCQMVSQSLQTGKGKKPYDVLVFKKPSGEEVSYYFDISKFYGKW